MISIYHARMARRAQHLRCSLMLRYVREANERTTGWIRYPSTVSFEPRTGRVLPGCAAPLYVSLRFVFNNKACCRFTTYRHRFARVAPARRPRSSWTRVARQQSLVAVIPDPRAARSLRFSPSEGREKYESNHCTNVQ